MTDLRVSGNHKAHRGSGIRTAAQLSEQPSCGLGAYGASPASAGTGTPGHRRRTPRLPPPASRPAGRSELLPTAIGQSPPALPETGGTGRPLQPTVTPATRPRPGSALHGARPRGTATHHGTVSRLLAKEPNHLTPPKPTQGCLVLPQSHRDTVADAVSLNTPPGVQDRRPLGCPPAARGPGALLRESAPKQSPALRGGTAPPEKALP